MQKKLKIILLVLLPIIFFNISLAQQRRNLNFAQENSIVVCTQNLENFGTLATMRERYPSMNKKSRNKKIQGLLSRFTQKSCDVIAVQEILGSNAKLARDAINDLSKSLSSFSGKPYKWLLGDGKDKFSRVGFLYNTNTTSLASSASYSDVELPRISKKQRPRYFLRGPLEIKIVPKKSSLNKPVIINLINIHFKSKSGAQRDPAQLAWETERMEMSEAVRRILLNRHKQSLVSPEQLLLVLGDRNSHFDSASSLILEGVLHLKDFQENGLCRLSKIGTPLCRALDSKLVGAQRLFSVLHRDPQVGKLSGSFSYKGQGSWIDDILLASPTLPFAEVKPGDYDSGLVYEPKNASDHALAWVQLRL
jgi:hypothetical protein